MYNNIKELVEQSREMNIRVAWAYPTYGSDIGIRKTCEYANIRGNYMPVGRRADDSIIVGDECWLIAGTIFKMVKQGDKTSFVEMKSHKELCDYANLNEDELAEALKDLRVNLQGQAMVAGIILSANLGHMDVLGFFLDEHDDGTKDVILRVRRR